MSKQRGLSALIYGPTKVGKTTFAFTAPYPRLVLDVEKSAKHQQGRAMVWWDPYNDDPPVADGTWDTCVVSVQAFEDVQATYRYLQTGRHQFRSVVLDSITELQNKAREAVAGRRQMQMQDWGELLSAMSFICRDFRDLIEHPTAPLDAVIITATNQEFKGINRPYLQGGIKDQFPFWFDLVGFLYTDQVVGADEQVYVERYLLTGINPEYVTGTRARLPEVISAPNVENMIDYAFGPAAQPAQTPQAPQTPDISAAAVDGAALTSTISDDIQER